MAGTFNAPQATNVWSVSWASELIRNLNAILPTLADGATNPNQYQFTLGAVTVPHSRQSVPTDTWKPAVQGYMAFIPMTQNTTLSIDPTGLVKGAELTLYLQQDATGGRTVTWGAGGGFALKWPSATAPTLVTTANRINILKFLWDGFSLNGWSVSLGSA